MIDVSGSRCRWAYGSADDCHSISLASVNPHWFLADRTIGRAFGTVCRLSVCLPVCDVLYCGETVRPSQKLSEGANRKTGSKS